MASILALKGGRPVRRAPFPSWPVSGAEERRLVLEVLDGGVWSGVGPKEREFAARFAAFSGATRAVCVSNGTVALEIALRALGVGPGDEVVVPALTWVATAWAAVQVGASPVFADVGENDWCLDPASVRDAITGRTSIVIPVHLYGQIAPLDEIVAIGRERAVDVVEDCAHAIGSRWADRGVGTLGRLGCFSFQQSKAITAGEGGALVTDDEGLAERVHALMDCGRPPREDGQPGFGGNHRITEFQAAVLLAQLDRLAQQMATKAENVARLRERLAGFPGVSALPPQERATRVGMYGFGMRYDRREFDDLPRKVFLQALEAEGVPVRIPYPPVYRSPLWTSGVSSLRWGPGDDARARLGLGARCPVAERVSKESGFVIPHEVFLGHAADMDDIVAALEKVRDHRSELRLLGWSRRARDGVRELFEDLGFRR